MTEYPAARLRLPYFRLRLLLTSLALLAGITAACDDGTSPPDISGHYELESLNGEGLPYLWTEGPFTEEWLDEAAITLRSDRGFLYIAEWRTTHANGSPDTRTTFSLEGTYVVRGDRISFFAQGEQWASGTLLEGAAFTLIGDNFAVHVFRN